MVLPGDSVERNVYRSGNSISNGEVVITQFRVSGGTARGVAAVETGTEGTGSYRRWGVLAKPNPSNPSQAMLVAQTVVGTTTSEVATLIQPGTFKRDAWYVVVLIVDDQNFFIRVWERDNPTVAGQYMAGFASGQNWHFTLRAQNGTSYLDSYSEGKLYSLDRSAYTAVQQPSGALPNGQAIWWKRLDWVEGLRFDGGSEWLATLDQYSYDSYANLIREVISYSNGTQWVNHKAIRSDYYPTISSSVYLVGLPGYTNQFKCPAGSVNGTCMAASLTADLLTSSEWYLYDGSISFSTPPTTGKLTGRRTQTRFAGANYTDGRFRDEVYSYDTWGNQSSSTVYNSEGTQTALASANPQVSTAVYDNTYHTYLLTQTNPLNQATSFGYNYPLGLPASMTGPNGSPTTITVEYDGLGRLIKVIRPDDGLSTPTLQIDYHDANPFWVQLTQRVDSSLNAVARKYYNGLGQLIQSQTIGATLFEGTNPQDVITDFSYDAYGRLRQQSVPYAVTSGTGYRTPQTQPSTQTVYDVLGRTTVITATDNTHTTFAYSITAVAGQAQTAQTDALNHTTTSLSDSFGRTKQVNPPTGPWVSYDYDTLDRLTQATRGGATTSLSYDLGGRKTQMTDPDMGTWNYAYDALGNLTKQTDAKGQRNCLYYDPLNRLIGKIYQTGDVCPTNPATYAVRYWYDEVDPITNPYAKGQRTRMEDGSGSASWVFDKRGRVTSETKTVTGQGSFRTQWAYNSADLQTYIVYPADNQGNAGEQVYSTYLPQMALKGIGNIQLPTNYVYNTAYDAAGRVRLRQLGLNEQNQPIMQTVYQYYDWALQGGRLSSIQAGPLATPTALMNFTYSYSAVGNVLNIQDYFDAGNTQTQTFTYDDLDRLISASAANGTQGNYGPEQYDLQRHHRQPGEQGRGELYLRGCEPQTRRDLALEWEQLWI